MYLFIFTYVQPAVVDCRLFAKLCDMPFLLHCLSLRHQVFLDCQVTTEKELDTVEVLKAIQKAKEVKDRKSGGGGGGGGGSKKVHSAPLSRETETSLYNEVVENMVNVCTQVFHQLNGRLTAKFPFAFLVFSLIITHQCGYVVPDLNTLEVIAFLMNNRHILWCAGVQSVSHYMSYVEYNRIDVLY